MILRWFLFVVAIAGLSKAAVFPVDLSVSEKDFVKIVTSFGVENGGELIMDLNVQEIPKSKNTSMVLSLFTDKQMDRYAHKLSYPAYLCYAPSMMRYEVETNTKVKHKIKWTEIYTLVLHDCLGPLSVKIKGSVELKNPHGEHLSLENVPLVAVESFLFCAYFLCSLYWFATYQWFRSQIVRMHRLLSVGFGLKFVESFVNLIFYKLMSATGKEWFILSMGRIVITSITETVFFTTLFLISMGWTITRSHLTEREKNMLISIFVCFLLLDFMKEICKSGSFCSVYYLSYQGIKFIVLFLIILSMNSIIERLRIAARDQWTENHTSILSKLKMFRLFRWVFIVYLIIPIFILVIQSSILSWQQQWISFLLTQLLILMIYIMIGQTFRPRRNNRYFHEQQDQEIAPFVHRFVQSFIRDTELVQIASERDNPNRPEGSASIPRNRTVSRNAPARNYESPPDALHGQQEQHPFSNPAENPGNQQLSERDSRMLPPNAPGFPQGRSGYSPNRRAIQDFSDLG